MKGRDATFATLIRNLMAMPRPADRQYYSIVVGDIVFMPNAIADAAKQPDFPEK